MEEMIKVAREALHQMPPASRFAEADAAVLAKHRELLLSWEDELVERFYDTLFAHGPTSAVFQEGERPGREKTLQNWWRKTMHGPIDDAYFGWMAMVGLVHVVRDVPNPMMLAMTPFIAEFIKEKATQEAGLDAADANAIVDAFQRLMNTVGAVITYGYDHARTDALFSVVGMDVGLLQRLTHDEAQVRLTKVRGT